MLLVQWRALVLHVNKLLEMSSDPTCAKSDRADAFTAMLTTLRLAVTDRRFKQQQLLASFVRFVSLTLRPVRAPGL